MTVLEHDLGAVLDRIVEEVESSQARIAIVDSLRTVEVEESHGTTSRPLRFVLRRRAMSPLRIDGMS